MLTVFYINCKISSNKPQSATYNERTPVTEMLIPFFKTFAATTSLIHFTWCEKDLLSECHWIMQATL
ncbi:unnamed protein product [Absidia cylindrospora]